MDSLTERLRVAVPRPIKYLNTSINYQDHLINKYKKFKKEDCPNANALMQNGFYLPSGNLIPDSDIDFVCEEIINLTK